MRITYTDSLADKGSKRGRWTAVYRSRRQAREQMLEFSVPPSERAVMDERTCICKLEDYAIKPELF